MGPDCAYNSGIQGSARTTSRITLTESLDQAERHGAMLDFGYVNVNRQPKLYKVQTRLEETRS